MQENTTELNHEYATYELLWQGIEIEIRHCPNWLSPRISGFQTDHMEIISKDCQKLPITETGYKSHFIDPEHIKEIGCVVTFVEAWLEDASTNKEWQAQIEANRQGSLFDW